MVLASTQVLLLNQVTLTASRELLIPKNPRFDSRYLPALGAEYEKSQPAVTAAITLQHARPHRYDEACGLSSGYNGVPGSKTIE